MVLLRSLKKSEDEIDTRLAKLEPRVKPQKCPWVPPCGPAFGSKIQRITDLESRNTAPPPGTYDPHEPLCQLKKSQLNIEPWKLAPPLPINQMTNLRIRPKSTRPFYYNLKSPIESDLENLARRSHSFDTYTVDRSAPVKHGYFAVDRVQSVSRPET
ncbi:unnamed protein product, partial [Hymenolepis diminuta]